MFPGLLPCRVSKRAIDELVAWMGSEKNSKGSNLRIPAGFTYLGQFVDHDITFDPTSKLGETVDPELLVNFRSPRLDLDSLYGLGPVAQPYLYDLKEEKPEGTRLLVARRKARGGGTFDDLPRNRQGRAFIGDARNDENVIISQLHLLFIRFHNAVVKHLVDKGELKTRDDLLREGQRIVRWHYQWIVAHEFLPLVVGDRMAEAVLPRPARGVRQKVRRRFFKWREEPFIPVEFSGAAYRFGHSMVRAEYGIKGIPATFAFTHEAEPPIPLIPNLNGFDFLDASLVIEWERFFARPGVQHSPQDSLMIDTAIAEPLFKLEDQDPGEQELPRRNLERGRTLGLPSGQDVAAVMHQRRLSENELELDKMPGSRAELKRATPLWFYILCETARARGPGGEDLAGMHLGPVGGRIVAEVIGGLLEGDPTSYVHAKRPWAPGELDKMGVEANGDFKMADLVGIAQGG
jgi:Animal haem peroxidase